MVVMTGVDNLTDNSPHPSPPPSHPPHLLEVTIISAQDLYPQTCHLSTYATAWVDFAHKLSTRVDTIGRTNPSWNDKFIFRVDESFLHSNTSSVTIDIYASTTVRKDPLVGTARVILSTLNPSSSTRFVALQVRRPKSLRPQGIVNIGIALLDNYMDSIPDEPAFALRDIGNTPNRSFPITPSHRSSIPGTPCERSFPRTSSNLSLTYYAGKTNEVEELKQGNAKGKEWKLQRNESVDDEHVAVEEQEAEELESKLLKWKTDLGPDDDMALKKNRRSISLPCFCGGSTMD